MTEKLPESRKIIVKFEELTTSPKTTENLFKFLELDGYDEKKIKNVLEKKLNVQQGGNFPKSIDWNKDLQEKAEKQYGKLRKIFGYKNNDEVSNKNHKLVKKNGKFKKKPKILFTRTEVSKYWGTS